jgi:hypothetical protein
MASLSSSGIAVLPIFAGLLFAVAAALWQSRSKWRK